MGAPEHAPGISTGIVRPSGTGGDLGEGDLGLGNTAIRAKGKEHVELPQDRGMIAGTDGDAGNDDLKDRVNEVDDVWLGLQLGKWRSRTKKAVLLPFSMSMLPSLLALAP